MSAVSGCIAPVRISSSSPPIALGRPAAIPAKMMIEIPLPRPRSVICSPSHIRNIVPVSSVDHGGQAEHEAWIEHQPRLRFEQQWQYQCPETAPGRRFRNAYIAVILRRPASPSFFRASSCGLATLISCMMIDAEMYGMIPSAKIVEARQCAARDMLNICPGCHPSGC